MSSSALAILKKNLPGGRVLFACIFLLSSSFLHAQPHMLFAKRGDSPLQDYGHAIATDSLGNTYVTGQFNGTEDFDPGPGVFNMTSTPGFPPDVFVVKVDANQNFLWAKQWGDLGDDYSYSIQVDVTGCVYVYGYFEGNVDFDPGPGVFMLNAQGASLDAYINKLDASGNFVWAKRIASGTGDAYGTSMTMDKAGNIYTAGWMNGLADMDPSTGSLIVGAPGVWSFFVAKYDTSGVVQWGKGMIGTTTIPNNWCFAVAADRNGNVYTTGFFNDTVDFDPGPGVHYLINNTVHEELYVSKLDSAGNFLWADHMQGGVSLGGWGLALLPDDSGNVYYSGRFHGTIDFDPGPGIYNLTYTAASSDIFLGKLDSLGNLIWTYALASYGNDYAYSLAMDSTNHILLLGIQGGDSLDYDVTSGVHMEYSSNNVESFFIAKYTPAAQLKCVFIVNHGYLGPYHMAHSLAVYGERVYVTGGFISTSDFDPCPATYNETSVGNHDLFYAAYDFSTCDCALQLATTSTNATCNGICSGSVTVTPLGGTPPYAYSWFPTGGNTSTASNLCAGTYTCIATDALGDSSSTVVAISEPALLTSTIIGMDLSCNAICNGNAQINVAGGTPGYTYSWSNSQTSAGISALCAGSYSVTVTDANGCTTTQSIAITQPSAIAATVSATPTPCYNNSGSVAATASGGTGTLNYLWQPGGYTTATVNNLAAGTYTVTITDQNGCMQVLADTVVSIGAPVTNVSAITDVMCNADSTGAATVNASGTGPFSYQWSPFGGNNAGATNLSAGTYTVLVTDNQGCTQTQLVSISEPTAIGVLVSSVNDNCTTGTGSISFTSSGGVGPYTCAWSNGQTTSAIAGLNAGTYSVTITDNNGCTFDTSVAISSTVPPSLSVTGFSNVLCFGDSTGSASINAIGGSAPYAYSWQPFGSSSANANGLSAGTYSVIVTGNDGCVDTIVVTITQPAQLLLNCSSVAENCSFQDGLAFVQANGGTGSYSYMWSNSATSDTITQVSAGTYSVVITDQNGCSEMCSVVVNTTATANADAGADVTIDIRQTAGLYGSGGVYYSWQPANDVACSTCAITTASPTVTTTFVLTVTDSAGCMDYDTVVVFVEIPCDDIFVPNAFSPNGDGQNDFLYLRGTCIETFTFSVYNRWGEKVFETSDQSVGWDGVWRGVPCENAVFTYKVQGTSTDGNPIKLQGNVSLVK